MPETQSPGIDLGTADNILSEWKGKGPEVLIPLLQDLQKAYGYLPADVLKRASRKTGIPLSRIHGVITYYTQFYTKPHGRHTIRTCEGTACHVKGSHRLCDHIGRELGIEAGATTEDGRFTFETVACLGTCFLAPVLMVDENYYGQVTPDKLNAILSRYE